MKRLFTVLLGTAMLIAVTTGAAAQTPAPWVLVLPADNQTDDASLDPIGATVAETISLTLTLLGDFEVREVPAEDIPEDVLRGNLSALRAFSAQQAMDYVVFGSVQSAGDGFDIEAAVWDRGADLVSVRQSGRADSLLDTFAVADELAVEFLSAFSGRRIAFGEVQLRRQGWQDGQYRVLIDGAEAARNATVVSGVLVGERTVAVEALTGPQAGEVLLDVPITVRENEVSSLSFTMQPPAEESEEIATAPVTDETDGEGDRNDAEEHRVVDEEVEADREGGVDYYGGLAYVAWRHDFNGRRRAISALDLWFDAAWRGGLELSGSVFLVFEPIEEYSPFIDGNNALATGAYEPEAESAVAVEASVGWSVYETPIGRRARVDVVPYGGVIYRYQWYFLRHTDGPSQDELVDVAFSSDEEWVYQQYLGLLGGVRARAVVGRFVARLGLGIDVNTAVGQAANGRELFVLDEGGNFIASGESLQGVPETGVSRRGSFGVGLAF